MADSGPIRVIAQSVGKNDAETVIITDTYNLVVAGRCYLAGAQVFRNGTHVLTIKSANGTSRTETPTMTGQEALAAIERGDLDGARRELARLDDDQVAQLDDNLVDLARLVREAGRS
jgi:hypothetical protein